MSTDFDWTYFDHFDGEFVPQKQGFRPPLKELPDGGYDLEVTDASMEMINGTAVLKVGIKVSGGSVFEHVYWLDSQPRMNALGADLATLGFDVSKWGKGAHLKDVMPDVLKKLPGVRFKASKTSRQDKDDKTKIYHNLNVVCRITGNAMPANPFQAPAAATPAASANTHSRPAAPAESNSNLTLEDIPF